jgi:hypothetical protein
MRQRPRQDSTDVLLPSFYITAGERTTIFRLAVIINFSVDVQPGFLFIRRKVFHDLHQVAHHFLTNSPHQGRALWRDANHHFAPVVARHRAHDHSQILQARDQTAGRGGSVPHLLRNRRHRQHFFLIEIREQKKLRERNVAGGEFLAEMQNETALHLEHDVGQALGVGTDFIGGTLCKRCFRVQSLLS